MELSRSLNLPPLGASKAQGPRLWAFLLASAFIHGAALYGVALISSVISNTRVAEHRSALPGRSLVAVHVVTDGLPDAASTRESDIPATRREIPVSAPIRQTDPWPVASETEPQGRAATDAPSPVQPATARPGPQDAGHVAGDDPARESASTRSSEESPRPRSGPWGGTMRPGWIERQRQVQEQAQWQARKVEAFRQLAAFQQSFSDLPRPPHALRCVITYMKRDCDEGADAYGDLLAARLAFLFRIDPGFAPIEVHYEPHRGWYAMVR